MKHKLYECKCKGMDRYCCYCDGGLACCIICKGGEGSLTTECCGRPITEDEERKVYIEKTLDFNNGKWGPPVKNI